MSLTICPECGKEISDKASSCVHCGYPIKKENNTLDTKNTKKFIYLCMCDECLSNPFKEFDEYQGDTTVCPDCGRILEYYETEIVDYKTDLVVKRITNEEKNNTKNTKAQNQPTCPICQSTNLSKISTFKKATKIGLFGIFGAGDIGKTWKCNDCGSKF